MFYFVATDITSRKNKLIKRPILINISMQIRATYWHCSVSRKPMKKINLNFYSNEVFSRMIISKMCQSCTSLQLYICPVINPVNSQTFTSSPAFMRIRHFRQIATLTAVNRIKQKHSEATISFLIISSFFKFFTSVNLEKNQTMIWRKKSFIFKNESISIPNYSVSLL